MKTTKKTSVNIAALFVCILTLVQFSCSKPENGTNGIDGKNGTVGPIGTANVFYSDWAPVTFTGSGTFSGTILAPKITQEIIDRGVVLVYFKFSNGVYPANLSVGTEFIYYGLVVGKINLFKTLSTISNTTDFRYIIIPGGVSVNGKMAQTDYSNMTYGQVCQSLQIPE